MKSCSGTCNFKGAQINFKSALSKPLILWYSSEELCYQDRDCVPYLADAFRPEYEVIQALVLTAATQVFEFVPIGESDAILPVCSDDMLFNVFDEYLGFLDEGV